MKNERDKNDKTELLYETDGMLTEFDATVIGTGTDEKNGADYAVLDRTAFFPEGGGQKADTGILTGPDGSRTAVTDVQTIEGQVRHFVDGKLTVGDKVHGSLDASQRFSRMQDHGAEHLICGLIHNEFGYDNVGFHMSEEGLVIANNGELSWDDLTRIEERANRIVFENVPITISFPSAREASDIQYRSKLDIEDNIRLVMIEGYDICACCAPHLDCTGRFGVIKIKDMMPHRGGTRITMIAGMDAYADYAMLHTDNSKIMALLSAGRDKTAGYVKDLMERYASLKEEYAMLKKSMTDIETEEVLKHIKERDEKDPSPELVFSRLKDPVGLRNLVNECTKVFEGTVCAFMEDEGSYRYIFAVCEKNAKSADLKGMVKAFNEACNGRGGGSGIMVQGSSQASRADIERFFSKMTIKP